MNYRDRFTVPEGYYLLSHSVGCLPHGAEAALNDACLEPWRQSGGHAWPIWLQTIDGFCGNIGDLISAKTEDICPQPSVSAAFSAYLSALPQSGRTKVVMHEDAFPTMGFVVEGLKRLGLELVLLTGDADDISLWEKHLSGDVLCALITHVHSNTGVVSPVAEIAKLLSENGAYSCVDVAQSVGIVPINVSEWGVDAVFGSCVKWLCGGPGAGFLCVDADHADTLTPMHLGWFSHQDPFEFDIRSFRASSGARKFWGGTPSVAPYALAGGSLATLGSIGFNTIQEHNLTLRNMALEGLEAMGLTARVAAESGGTLCLALEPDQADRLAKMLEDNACKFDRRRNTVRLSFHIYNAAEDALLINRLLKDCL